MLDVWREGGESTDAAGQAGIILRILWELRGAPMAALVARSVRKREKCKHCRDGHVFTADWTEAINILAASALAAGVGGARYDLRLLALHRVYSKHQNFREMANGLEMDEETVSKHSKAMEAWLGVRGSAEERAAGIESRALVRAQQLLAEAGLLETSA